LFPGLAIPQRFVYLTRHPQPVQQYGQFPRYRYDRSLLGIFAPAFGQLQSPSLEIRIRPTLPQNAMRSLYQQLSQVSIAFFGYP
jgi:hypothetical protein